MTQPKSSALLDSIANSLVHRRMALLALAAAVTLVSFVEASHLKLERSIESLYALDDPHLIDYRESKSLFGGDEFVIVAYEVPDLLSQEQLNDVRAFADELSKVPGVREQSTQDLAKVLAPANIPWFLRPLFVRRRDELVEFASSILIGADNRTTGIVLRLVPEDQTSVSRGETINAIRALAAAHQPPAYVVGEPVQVHDMFEYVDEDGQRLFYASLALLAAVIFALFRSVRWVLLSVALVAVTVIWTKAILVVFQMRLSMVSSMLNSLVTIVGIATVMRVMVYYREQRSTLSPEDSFRKTFAEISPAVWWTTVTAAAGFVSLLSSAITPVRSFGTMMTLGTMLVLVTGAMLLPAGILYGRMGADIATGKAEQRLIRLLGELTDWVERHSALVIGSVVLLSVLSVAGLFRLRLDTDFSRNFRSSSPIVRGLDFVETHLGGAGTWEVNFPAPSELTPEFLQKVRETAERLRHLSDQEPDAPRLTKVVAITDLLDLLPGELPDAAAVRHKLDMLHNFQPEFEPSLYNAQHKRMRLVLRSKERQPSEAKLRLIDAVGRIARDEFHEAKTTGIYVLLTFLIESLLRDQVVSFILTVIMVLLIMVAAYKSLAIGAVSLIPNVFPIVLVVGAMGWIDLPINVGTAMIAAVSMGLTIDASIFYLYGYRRSRAGMSVKEALRQTHQGFGRALFFGTLALVVGFSVLALSRFVPLVYFGVLVSLAMLGGLIGNLLLLPLLLPLVDRDSKSTGSLPSIPEEVGQDKGPQSLPRSV